MFAATLALVSVGKEVRSFVSGPLSLPAPPTPRQLQPWNPVPLSATAPVHRIPSADEINRTVSATNQRQQFGEIIPLPPVPQRQQQRLLRLPDPDGAVPSNPLEELPDGPANGTPFPALPPAPGDVRQQELLLPPLEWELANHGGSYMYETEDERAQYASQYDEHSVRLRLPEGYCAPQPFTLFGPFLGPGPIRPWPGFTWFGCDGYQWEPRFVGFGSYEMFGIAFEQNGQRADVIGQQLLLDLDLRLTGTERFHVQYRPLGERNSGGSYYMFNNPSGYVDNSTAIPDRYWFEFELDSVFGGVLGDTRTAFDHHITLGKFPFALHNNLLINDEVLGIVVSKNSLLIPPFSNVSVQTFWLPDEVDAFNDGAADVFGAHLQADYRGSFAELTYAFVDHRRLADRSANYAAASYTKFFGPLSLAGRAIFKWGDAAGRGNGELFVLESNLTRIINSGWLCACGVKEAVYYANGFAATPGWNSISGGNFNRLTSSFAVNPLVAISAAPVVGDRYGAAAGVQLFRHHQDESLVPEIAYERADGSNVFGLGLQYLRKIGPRSYLDVRAVGGFSSDPRFRREGAFVSYMFAF